MFSQSFAFLEDGLHNPQQHLPQPLQQPPKQHKPPKPPKQKSRGSDPSGASSPNLQNNGGGLFKTNLFATTKRPSTSGGVKSKTPSELLSEPIPGQLSRQTSFRRRFNSTPTTSFSPETQTSATVLSGIQLPDDARAPSPFERRETEPRVSVGIRPKEVVTAAHSSSRRESHTPQPLPNMLARPGTSYSSHGATGGPGIVPPALPSPTLENITYLHIQETSSKRISTLDYLRKAYVSS